jgi:hypothetical protein
VAHAPIALFVYARPEHTRRTVEALLQNPLCASSELVIYSDGPRGSEDIHMVGEVRAYVGGISGFGKITVVERAENIGLAQNITRGVTEILKRSGRVIVLEDDIVVTQRFLDYMNIALEKYVHVEKVGSIAGSAFPTPMWFRPEGDYLYRVPLCWGWGTWADRWADIDLSRENLLSLSPAERRYLDLSGAAEFTRQVDLNISGEISTWFIYWYIAMMRAGRLTVYPARPIARNAGHDGTGQNTGRSRRISGLRVSDDWMILDKPALDGENEWAVRANQYYFVSTRIRRAVGEILRGVLDRGRS